MLKVLKQIFENNRLFSLINALVSDFTSINFEEFDKLLKWSHGNIVIDKDLNISLIEYWYSENRDNFKNLYNSLVTTYNILADKNVTTTKTFAEKEADIKRNDVINGLRKTTESYDEVNNEHYTTTYENATQGRLESYDKTPSFDKTTTITDEVKEGETEKGNKITTGYNGENVTLNNGEETISGNKVNVSRETITGNNGNVPQDLIEKEIYLRVNYNFLKLFKEKFLQEMTLNYWSDLNVD